MSGHTTKQTGKASMAWHLCSPLVPAIGLPSLFRSLGNRAVIAICSRFHFQPAVFVLRQVILLFQRIEGVDVCLFCVYTQEYGEDCPGPNSCVILQCTDMLDASLSALS